MWAIFEGPDGGGKSTLAERVADEMSRRHPGDKVEVHHKGPPKQDILKEYAYDYESYRPGDGLHIASDRHHLGELIYPQLYRDVTLGPYGVLNQSGWRWVELLLLARGVRTWIVDQPLDKLNERLNGRGDDYIDMKDVERLRSRYLEVAQETATLVDVITPPDGDYPDLVSGIVDVAERMGGAAAWLRAFPSYIGLHRPNVLLVGDRRNGDGPHPSEACFCPDNKNRSGHFLLEALPEDFWRGIGIVNVNETTNFEDLYDGLHQPAIVALGRNASDALMDMDIDHAAVPHPSHVKRFGRKKQQEYGQLIREVSLTGEVKLGWLT